MRKRTTTDHDPDLLRYVAERLVLEELEITPMTANRWDRRKTLLADGWPPAVYIEGRKYRSRKMLDAFKRRRLEEAVATEGKMRRPQNRGPKPKRKLAA